MEPLTIKKLKQLCEMQIKKGNGDKVIMISDDDEGNGFHYLWYAFSSIEEAGAEQCISEQVASKDNTIILG